MFKKGENLKFEDFEISTVDNRGWFVYSKNNKYLRHDGTLQHGINGKSESFWTSEFEAIKALNKFLIKNKVIKVEILNGKKKVSIIKDEVSTDLRVMINGYQWVGVSIDNEIIEMIELAIKQYKAKKQVITPVEPLTKEQIDIQLIEACILEKWNPKAMGCKVYGSEVETCCLCQVYNNGMGCTNCPVKNYSKKSFCYGTPYEELLDMKPDAQSRHDINEAEIEFLISLLPINHKWRKE